MNDRMNEKESPIVKYKFKKSELSVREKIGEKDLEIHSVIGRIVVDFNHLEENVSLAIIKLINTDKNVGLIITSELSFRNKLNLLGSLFNKKKDTHHFNSFFQNIEEGFNELLKACYRCEEFRNKYLHSNFYVEHNSEIEFRRVKKTSKAKKGLSEQNEIIDSGFLLDIADYTYGIAEDVEDFFYDYQKK